MDWRSKDIPTTRPTQSPTKSATTEDEEVWGRKRRKQSGHFEEKEADSGSRGSQENMREEERGNEDREEGRVKEKGRGSSKRLGRELAGSNKREVRKKFVYDEWWYREVEWEEGQDEPGRRTMTSSFTDDGGGQRGHGG